MIVFLLAAALVLFVASLAVYAPWESPPVFSMTRTVAWLGTWVFGSLVAALGLVWLLLGEFLR